MNPRRAGNERLAVAQTVSGGAKESVSKRERTACQGRKVRSSDVRLSIAGLHSKAEIRNQRKSDKAEMEAKSVPQ